MQSLQPRLTFTVCICTRNRPDDLRKALQSIRESDHPINQVVISDDSTDSRTRDLIRLEFLEATFTEGPRKGLGANRNNALRSVTSSHVLFIDDDVILAPDFVSQVQTFLSSLPEPDRTLAIVTGTEINDGRRVFPHKPSFLGFQALEYGSGDRIESVVINSTVCPITLFSKCRFDENLVYGCDEIDIARQAVYLAGYRIHLLPDAANRHYPSPVNRDYYQPFINASRIYVTYKAYRYMHRNRAKAYTFLAIAYAHSFLANVKASGLRGLGPFHTTVTKSASYIRKHRSHAAGQHLSSSFASVSRTAE